MNLDEALTVLEAFVNGASAAPSDLFEVVAAAAYVALRAHLRVSALEEKLLPESMD